MYPNLELILIQQDSSIDKYIVGIILKHNTYNDLCSLIHVRLNFDQYFRIALKIPPIWMIFELTLHKDYSGVVLLQKKTSPSLPKCSASFGPKKKC